MQSVNRGCGSILERDQFANSFLGQGDALGDTIEHVHSGVAAVICIQPDFLQMYACRYGNTGNHSLNSSFLAGQV